MKKFFIFLLISKILLAQIPTMGSTGGSTPSLTNEYTPPGANVSRNDLTGCQGHQFTVNSNITIKTIGRYVFSGNSQTHNLHITDSSGNFLATASLNTSGQPAGAIAFVTLGTPLAVTTGNTYYEVSEETNGGDGWMDFTSGNTPASQVNITTAAFSTTAASGTACGTLSTAGGAGTMYNRVMFQF